MIFGWPMEVIGAIFLMILLICIFIGVLYTSFKKYENGEKTAGNVILEIVPSKRILRIRKLDCIVGIVLFLFFYLSDIIRYQTFPPQRLEFGIILIGVFANCCLENKSQKICENGILVRYGLVSWANIRKIMPVDETDDKIKIKLYKRMGGFKTVILYCEAEDIMNIVHTIEQKMKSLD